MPKSIFRAKLNCVQIILHPLFLTQDALKETCIHKRILRFHPKNVLFTGSKPSVQFLPQVCTPWTILGQEHFPCSIMEQLIIWVPELSLKMQFRNYRLAMLRTEFCKFFVLSFIMSLHTEFPLYDAVYALTSSYPACFCKHVRPNIIWTPRTCTTLWRSFYKCYSTQNSAVGCGNLTILYIYIITVKKNYSWTTFSLLVDNNTGLEIVNKTKCSNTTDHMWLSSCTPTRSSELQMTSQSTTNRPLECNTFTIDNIIHLIPFCTTLWRQKCKSEKFSVKCLWRYKIRVKCLIYSTYVKSTLEAGTYTKLWRFLTQQIKSKVNVICMNLLANLSFFPLLKLHTKISHKTRFFIVNVILFLHMYIFRFQFERLIITCHC
jgi:hypothetical protein